MENTSKRTGVFLWCEEGYPNNSRKASSTFLTGIFGLTYTLFDAVDRTDFAAQAYFSCHTYACFNFCIHVAGKNGTDNCQVYGGIVDFQPSGNVQEHIFLSQLESDTFFKYSQQHVHTAQVESGGGTLRLC